MNSDSLVRRLLDAGYDPADAQSRAVMVTSVSAALEAMAGGPPQWCWCVPGRIEIFGKHTDYAGGQSLLAAVPRGFAVAARPRTDQVVRVCDARHGDSVTIDVRDTGHERRGWANYVAVTVRRLALNFPEVPLGTDIVIMSDLPRAAGLSSSSALVVALALAVVRRAGLETHEGWREQIGSVEELAWYLGCVENGLAYKSLAGTAGVGTHGGSQDHTAILACRPGVVSRYSFVPVAAHDVVPMPPGWRFVVAPSGVRADKAGSVRDQYNRASLAVQALLDLWNTTAAVPARSLAAVLASGPDAHNELRDFTLRGPVAGFTGDELGRRLSQFVREMARVPLAATAFASADPDSLGTLARASQEDAELLLRNQIPETVALAELAYQEGAIAASAFGAGFGGSVWALVADADAEAFGRAWTGQFRQAFPQRDTSEWFSAVPGPGAIEVAVT